MNTLKSVLPSFLIEAKSKLNSAQPTPCLNPWCCSGWRKIVPHSCWFYFEFLTRDFQKFLHGMPSLNPQVSICFCLKFIFFRSPILILSCFPEGLTSASPPLSWNFLSMRSISIAISFVSFLAYLCLSSFSHCPFLPSIHLSTLLSSFPLFRHTILVISAMQQVIQTQHFKRNLLWRAIK